MRLSPPNLVKLTGFDPLEKKSANYWFMVRSIWFCVSLIQFSMESLLLPYLNCHLSFFLPSSPHQSENPMSTPYLLSRSHLTRATDHHHRVITTIKASIGFSTIIFTSRLWFEWFSWCCDRDNESFVLASSTYHWDLCDSQ